MGGFLVYSCTKITNIMDTKIIMCAFALVLGASSCAKTEQGRPNEPVKVTINVRGLDVDVEPMTKSKDASNGLTKIQYAIFNSSTNKTGTQVSTDTGFGTIELWLTPGTYSAYFAGTTDTNKGILMDKTNGSSPYYYINESNADVFFSGESLTITANSNAYTIDMSRLTGQLVVDLTDDDVPDDIAKATAVFPLAAQYNIKTNATTAPTTNKSTDITITGGAFNDVSHFLFPVTNQSVTISLLDANGGVLGSTSVNYDIIANKRTIIRGNILDIVTQKGLSVQYDDTWDDDNIVDLNGND